MCINGCNNWEASILPSDEIPSLCSIDRKYCSASCYWRGLQACGRTLYHYVSCKTTFSWGTYWRYIHIVHTYGIVIAISALIGLLLGLPSIRVREDFLAITTIGINFIVEAIFRYVPFFGGALGIGGIPKIAFYGIRLKGIPFFILCLLFLFLVIGLCYWLKKSWASLACYAIREEEQVASTLGISPVRFKLLAFVIGTAIAGLGGSLYAHYMQFISAGDFSFPISVGFLSMLVLGGMGTLWGPVLGTLILGILPEIFRPLVDYRVLLYTILLLIMIRFQPGGLLGEGSVIRKIFEALLRVK